MSCFVFFFQNCTIQGWISSSRVGFNLPPNTLDKNILYVCYICVDFVLALNFVCPVQIVERTEDFKCIDRILQVITDNQLYMCKLFF